MQQNINIKRPGKISQVEQDSPRVEDAILDIGEKRSPKISIRIPKWENALMKALSGVMPHRKIKQHDVTAHKTHPAKNDIRKNKRKKGAIKTKKQEEL